MSNNEYRNFTISDHKEKLKQIIMLFFKKYNGMTE